MDRIPRADLDPSLEVPNPIGRNPFSILVFKMKSKVSDPPRLRERLMKWHDDLQFVVVVKGAVSIDTPLGHRDLPEGSAAFFNSGTPHRVVSEEVEEHISIVFPAKVLGFFPGSSMAERCVDPYIGPDSPLATFFDGTEAWHEGVIEHLLAAAEASSKPDEQGLYHYRTALEIVCAWMRYIENVGVLRPDRQSRVQNERIRSYIAFIEEHYADRISLSDIAAAGSTSEAECVRCFKKALGTTPYAYLLAHRVSVACDLIRQREQSVTEIALNTGFGSASHFSKTFKRIMGMPPQAYGKRCR